MKGVGFFPFYWAGFMIRPYRQRRGGFAAVRKPPLGTGNDRLMRGLTVERCLALGIAALGVFPRSLSKGFSRPSPRPLRVLEREKGRARKYRPFVKPIAPPPQKKNTSGKNRTAIIREIRG